MKKIIVVMLLAAAAFAAWALGSGATFLEATLPGGLPLGNALAALCPCAVAGAAVLLSTPRTVLRAVSATSFFAAALWLPASVLLADNLTLNNMSGWHGLVWFIYTAAMALAALVSLLWALVASLRAIRRCAGAA